MSKRKRYNLSVDSIHDSKIGIKYHLDDKLVDLLNNLDRRINWFKTLVNSTYGLPSKNKDKIELLEKLNSDWYKICPRCGNPYGASQFPSKDENGKKIYVCSNCNLIKTVYEPQLATKEKDKIELLEKLKKHYCKKMWDGRSSTDAWVIQECVDLIDKELANIRRLHESS